MWQGDHKVPQNIALFDSLQHHVILTNRIEYQVGGQEHECKASSCLVGGKYMVALEREKKDRRKGKARDNSSVRVGHIWMDSRTS